MTYFSITFFAILLPIVIILYNLVPKKHRWKILLLGSYIFSWIISGKLLIYLIISTISIHYLGIWIDSLKQERDELLQNAEKEEKKLIKDKYKKKTRKIVLLSIIVNVGILLVLKYSAFAITNLNDILKIFNIETAFEVPKFLMPIGISFYTLQAVSYIVDVYRGTIKADKNLGRLALYMSFFPQIMEGPICRYGETAQQLWKCERTTYKNLTFGLQRLAYGFFKKMIIADRLNILISSIFDGYANLDGGIIAIGMVLYTLQLYADFSGTMDVVIGIAEIFGVKLPENFKQPFFSKSISDFWTRWHITLGAWFRDYIFYPVSLAEKLKKLTSSARKKIGNYYGPLIASSIALFSVWICNGLWHGAAWSFIFYGMYHFSLILLGKITDPLFKKINKKLHINNEWKIYKLFQILRTTILVFVGELFFRANTLTDGFNMFGKMITNFSFNMINDGTILNLGIDAKDFLIVGIMTIVIFIISILKEKNIQIRESIAKKNIVIRWIIYYALILSIIIFGAYGMGYTPVDPMYANF